MLYTPLHRVLGEHPGPLTDGMIDEAISQGIEEDGELDWKKVLPKERDFRESDIVKDIAAFANADGGMIVFGVTEDGKAANGRFDAGELTENYERTVRQVSMTGITPPVFGVRTISIPSTAAEHAVAIVVPASPDGPHLVYRNDQFGAPLRVGADTHWMKERQLEAAYRSRFEGARRGEQALQHLYDEMTAAVGASGCAVLVGAARPRSLRPRVEPLDEVTSTANRATLLARWWLAGIAKYNPLEDLAIHNDRPTLDGQYLPPNERGGYREAHAVVLDDGSIGLSWRAGGHEHLKTGRQYEPHQVATHAIEGFAGALVALVHTVAAERSVGDYEIVLGVELPDTGLRQLEFHEHNAAPPSGVHRTLSGRFRPVRLTVDPSVDDTGFIQAAIDLATSALNQIGIKAPAVLDTMLPRRPREWNW